MQQRIFDADLFVVVTIKRHGGPFLIYTLSLFVFELFSYVLNRPLSINLQNASILRSKLAYL